MRFYMFLLVLAIVVPIINGFNNTPRKLQDESPHDLENKCGGCPCNSPCVQVPPPPPPSPSPPPPSPPPPAPKPPSINCPPPPPPTCGSCGNNPSVPTPPSQYIYVSGTPGNLYPVDAYYNQAGQQYTVGLPFLIGCILLGLQVLL